MFAHSTFVRDPNTGDLVQQALFMSSSQVKFDKIPMPPPQGSTPLVVGTLQPAGVVLNPPAQVTYPNVEGLAPGDVADIFAFHHDIGQFVNLGPGTVSEDGSVVVSDPGFGIVKSGWHCLIRIPGPASSCKRQNGCNVDITLTRTDSENNVTNVPETDSAVLCIRDDPNQPKEKLKIELTFSSDGSPNGDAVASQGFETTNWTVDPLLNAVGTPSAGGNMAQITVETTTTAGTATVLSPIYKIEFVDQPDGTPVPPATCQVQIDVHVVKLEITDTFDQSLPDVVETFHRVFFPFVQAVNKIGFKVKVSNLPAGVTITNYEWDLDTNHGGLANLEPADPPIPSPTVKMGPNARGIQFESWTGITGAPTKKVKVEVTLSNGVICSDEIQVKVLDFLTGTGGLLTEHVNWHTQFEPVGNNPGNPVNYKAGYIFFRFHRRFAVTDMNNYRSANGLPAIVDTPDLPLLWPYPLRKTTPPPPYVTPPTPAMPASPTSDELGVFVQGWHAALHNHMCDHGDAFTLTSPRDLGLYWFHKRVDAFWTTWLTNNPNAPHF